VKTGPPARGNSGDVVGGKRGADVEKRPDMLVPAIFVMRSLP